MRNKTVAVMSLNLSVRRSTTHSGVGGQTGSAQIWSTIHQQLRVPDLPPDVSLTDRASCPQQVTLVMMRPIVSTAQSMKSLCGTNLGSMLRWHVRKSSTACYSIVTKSTSSPQAVTLSWEDSYTRRPVLGLWSE